MEISVLDLSVLTNGTTQEQAIFCQALLDCCTRYGFIKLVNHGIPESYISDCFDLVSEHIQVLYIPTNLPVEP